MNHNFWQKRGRALVAFFLGPHIAWAFVAPAGYLMWREDPMITQENHLLENGQVVFLALAAAFHLWQVFRLGDPSGQLYHKVLGTLCLSVLIREVDIDRLGAGSGWEFLELGVRGLLVGVWLLLLYVLWRLRYRLWASRHHFVFTRNSYLTVCAIAFYVAGWFFDHGFIPVAPDVNELCEELLELYGTLFFFAGAWKPIELPLSDA